MSLSTNQEIKAASNDGASLKEHIISKAPGLVLQVMPRQKDGSNSKKWAFRFKKSGTRRRIPLGMYPEVTLEAARKAARALASQVDRGEAPGIKRRSGTFSDLLDEYLIEQRGLSSMVERERELRKDAVPILGDMRPAHIKPSDIDRVISSILDRGSEVMAFRAATALKAMFNYALLDAPAMAERYEITSNPAAMFGRKRRGAKGRIKASPPRKRVLSDEELGVWLSAVDFSNMNEMTKIGLKLVLITGQRPGEVRKARREDVNLDAGTWFNRDTKSNIDNLVHLTAPARELFSEAMGAGRTQYLFPDKHEPKEPVNNVAWPSAQKHLFKKWITNMPTATVHDLRRTCATGMGKLGVPQHIIDACQARVPQGVGATTYNHHDYAEEKAEAWERWSTHLMSE